MSNSSDLRTIVGLIPAGGTASRMGKLPFSKELLPLGLGEGGNSGSLKVVSSLLVEKMRKGGASNAYFVLARGKWDIPAYFGSGKEQGLPLSYLITETPYGVPFTIDHAYPFVQGKVVLLGFPDLIYDEDDLFTKAVDRLRETNEHAVLIAMETYEKSSSDLILADESGQVKEIEIKPLAPQFDLSWASAVWSAAFTDFLHAWVEENLIECEQNWAYPGQYKEPHMGTVFQSAIQNGLKIGSVKVGGFFRDVGTPNGLWRALKQ